MMRAMWSAAAGMNVQTTNMDTISNNLANVNTTGFKKARAEFQDLLYQTINTAGTNTSTTTTYPGQHPDRPRRRLSAMVKDFTTGSLKQHQQPVRHGHRGQRASSGSPCPTAPWPTPGTAPSPSTRTATW